MESNRNKLNPEEVIGTTKYIPKQISNKFWPQVEGQGRFKLINSHQIYPQNEISIDVKEDLQRHKCN